MPKIRTVRNRNRQPPEGWDLIEPTIEELEAKMREALIVETIGVSNLTNPLSDNLSRQLTMNLQEKKY